MSQNTLLPDDPKLTAYALGELEGEDRAAVETALRNDAAARAALEGIRATVAQLSAALAVEPMPQVEPATAPVARRAAIVPGRDPRKLDGGPAPYLEEKWIKFPQFYYVAGLAAAACFAVVVVLHKPVSHPAPEKKEYTEIAFVRTSVSPKVGMPVAEAPATTIAVEAPAVIALSDEIKTPKISTDVPKELLNIPFEAKNDAVIAATKGGLDSPPVPAVAPDGSRVASSTGASASAPALATDPAGEFISPASFKDSVSADRSSADKGKYSWFTKEAGGRRDLAQATPRSRFIPGTDAFAYAPDNNFLNALQNPLSSFPIASGTASYAEVRRFLENGARPPRDAVRIEELLNYFSYGYPAPKPKDDKLFAASLEVAAAPWSPAHRLVRIGLKGREAEAASAEPTAIAKDVKVQVEFNPAKVASYRLIGYENQQPKKEDSNKVQAGEVGAGHTVTALYEVVPVGATEKPAGVSPVTEELKYQRASAPGSRLEMLAGKNEATSNELLTVKVRYKKPDGFMSRKLEFPLTDKGAAFADASSDFKFAAAVAGFGMILRESPHKGTATLSDVIFWAGPATNDPSGHRDEFIGLVRKAQATLR